MLFPAAFEATNTSKKPKLTLLQHAVALKRRTGGKHHQHNVLMYLWYSGQDTEYRIKGSASVHSLPPHSDLN